MSGGPAVTRLSAVVAAALTGALAFAVGLGCGRTPAGAADPKKPDEPSGWTSEWMVNHKFAEPYSGKGPK
jgi:hypothetical protein